MTTTDALLALGIIPLSAFIYRYWRPMAWIRTYQGRTLMSQMIAWWLLLAHFLAESIWGYPGSDIVQIAVISLTVLMFWATLLGLLLAQGALDWLGDFWREQTGRLPKLFRKVSRKRGTGYVNDADIERTQPRKPTGR